MIFVLTFSFRRAFTGGPVRNRPSRGGGGSSANTNTNAVRVPKGSKKPKTVEELDQELDAFMGDTDVPAGDATVSAAGDVDMV